MVIVWTLNAQKDLRSIYNFYLTKSMKVAIDMRKDILNAVKRLCYFPQMAQVELLLNDKSFIYRSLIVRDIFKIIYRVDEKKVYIIAIWDCRQNPETLEKRIK